MKKYAIFLLSVFLMIQLQAKEYSVTSPSEKLTVKIAVNENVQYSVFIGDNEIISPSPISMTLENKVLGEDAKSGVHKQLVESELIYKLAPENVLEDTGWITTELTNPLVSTACIRM